MPNGFTPGEPSHAKTIHDSLPLPGGKTIGSERKLTSILLALDAPGVTATNGREANAQAYADYLGSIRFDAAEAAVAAWLQSKAGA